MSKYGPFEVGDKVLVSGPSMSGWKIVRPRPGTITSADQNDPVWHYMVNLDTPYRRHESGWFQATSVEPAIKVPKFKTQAEADAWLEKHSRGAT